MNVLFVGGWEPVGVAGLAVDVSVAASLGVRALGAITAVTAQGPGVHAIDPTRDDLFGYQLDRTSRAPIAAVKVGALGAARHVRRLTRWLEGRELPVIYDPVLRASTGGELIVEADLAALRALLPRVDLVTPNLDEAERLCGLSRGALVDDEAIEDAARRLLELGARAALVKGGHRGGGFSQDFFLSRSGERAWLSGPRRQDARGTGCALASAIACALAWGPPRVPGLLDAIVVGRAYLARGLRGAVALDPDDEATRALAHGAWPVDAEDLPWITDAAEEGRRPLAAPAETMGFYPIVSRAAQIAPLVRAGVETMQLRVKDLAGAALRAELAAGVDAARGRRLYVNDHLELAIELRAHGVHLGQEDLRAVGHAGVARAIAAGLRVGLSTHAYAELARARAVGPSYVALGPIYPTTLKAMRFAPQGPARLGEWRRLCAAPLVAIGGVTLGRVPELSAADGVSVVSDLVVGGDVEARARDYLAAARKGRC